MQGATMNKSKDVVQQGNNWIKHANNKFALLVRIHRTTTLKDNQFIGPINVWLTTLAFSGCRWDHFLHGNNVSLHNFQIIIGFAFLVDNV
jgi:hypothetical protein